MATLSISKAWEETVAFVKREGQLLFPVAFALIALPFVILIEMLPANYAGFNPAAGGKPPEVPPIIAIGFLISGILSIMGALTIYMLALKPGISVGEALQRGVRRTPVLLGALILVGLVIGIGILALVLMLGMLALAIGPGVAKFLASFLIGGVLTYASARFLLLNIIVADTGLSVIASIRESWTMGRGHVWRLILFLVVFFLLLAVVQSAAQAIFGLIGRLIGGAELAGLLGALGGAIAGSAVQVYLLVMTARIYAQVKTD